LMTDSGRLNVTDLFNSITVFNSLQWPFYFGINGNLSLS
jgi:hypothetical protein